MAKTDIGAILWQTPEFVAEQLAEILEIPVQSCRIDNIEDVDNLPVGYVDWEGNVEWDWRARDQSATSSLFLVIAVAVDGSGPMAMRQLRQLVGQVLNWCLEKRSLNDKEVGAPVKRLLVENVDWQEVSDKTGFELHGKIIQAGGVLVRLEVYI
jgi:hypothetical protein